MIESYLFYDLLTNIALERPDDPEIILADEVTEISV